jgi:hypothetical protein
VNIDPKTLLNNDIFKEITNIEEYFILLQMFLSTSKFMYVYVFILWVNRINHSNNIFLQRRGDLVLKYLSYVIIRPNISQT